MFPSKPTLNFGKLLHASNACCIDCIKIAINVSHLGGTIWSRKSRSFAVARYLEAQERSYPQLLAASKSLPPFAE